MVPSAHHRRQGDPGGDPVDAVRRVFHLGAGAVVVEVVGHFLPDLLALREDAGALRVRFLLRPCLDGELLESVEGIVVVHVHRARRIRRAEVDGSARYAGSAVADARSVRRGDVARDVARVGERELLLAHVPDAHVVGIPHALDLRDDRLRASVARDDLSGRRQRGHLHPDGRDAVRVPCVDLVRKELAACVGEAEVESARLLEVGVAEPVDAGLGKLHEDGEVGKRRRARVAGERDVDGLREHVGRELVGNDQVGEEPSLGKVVHGGIFAVRRKAVKPAFWVRIVYPRRPGDVVRFAEPRDHGEIVRDVGVRGDLVPDIELVHHELVAGSVHVEPALVQVPFQGAAVGRRERHVRRAAALLPLFALVREVPWIVAVHHNGDVVVPRGERDPVEFRRIFGLGEDPRLAGVAGVKEDQSGRVGLAYFPDGVLLHCADVAEVRRVRLVRKLEDELVRVVLVAFGNRLPKRDELVGARGVCRVDVEPAVEIQDDVEPGVDRIGNDRVDYADWIMRFADRRSAPGKLRLVGCVKRHGAGAGIVGRKVAEVDREAHMVEALGDKPGIDALLRHPRAVASVVVAVEAHSAHERQPRGLRDFGVRGKQLRCAERERNGEKLLHGCLVHLRKNSGARVGGEYTTG